MRKWILFMLWSCIGIPVFAQVTLTECVEKARNNYPQIKELDLIREAENTTCRMPAKVGYRS